VLIEFRITLSLILAELLIDIVQQEITVTDDVEHILLAAFISQLQRIHDFLRTGDDVVHILGITPHAVELYLCSCSQRKQEQTGCA
jgi:hypothetical protein